MYLFLLNTRKGRSRPIPPPFLIPRRFCRGFLTRATVIVDRNFQHRTCLRFDDGYGIKNRRVEDLGSFSNKKPDSFSSGFVKYSKTNKNRPK